MKVSSKPRILFVINSLAGGGAERVFVTLVQHSQMHGEQYHIIVVLLDDESDEAYRLPEWVDVVRLRCRGRLIASVLRLMALVRSLRPVSILSFLTRANIASVIAGRIIGARVVISERVNTTAHLRNGRLAAFSRAIIRFTYPRASAIVAVSQGVKDTLVADFGVSAARVLVIENPVDSERIRYEATAPDPIGVDEKDWVTMGRLVPNKNAALAIEAFSRSGLPGRLFILGEGPMHDFLFSLAKSRDLSERVCLPGFMANPYAVVARAGAYLLPSDAEGFPNALVEAMALGLPVVATDCPSGPAEILKAQLNGFDIAQGMGGILVRRGDAAAMSKAMQKISDPDLREQLGAQARARAADFSVDKAVARFWNILCMPQDLQLAAPQ